MNIIVLRGMKWIRFVVVFFLSTWTELNGSTSMEHFPYDRLSPYEEGLHGSRRSARDISQCQHVDWDNLTYEEYQSQIPVPKSIDILYDLYRFEDTFKNGDNPPLSVHRIKYLMGSIAFVKDAYYTLSILEPSEPGGCKKNYFGATRSTVSATAMKRAKGCKLAINAGYFSMSNGQCLGNIVSDGRIIQTTSDQNANFGIRHDGTLVVGYIPEEEILDGSFRQLISGVIWLVRNGTNHVNESMSLECSSHQDTGKMSTFVNVMSARTAVGYDGQGRIVIANVEGQTHRRGSDLYQFADLLVSHGIINAINLDGGGSSTYIHNQVLINYPSDHCPANPAYRCERPVSTILCFHDVQCLEPFCNGHGSCYLGNCNCNVPWIGNYCDHLNCSLVNCSNHGNCTDGLCTCESGWKGSLCEKECSSNHYGPGCTSQCWCYGRAVCDRVTGACQCPPGYSGFGCWKECPAGFYGLNCSHRCPYPNCSSHGDCSPINGTCLCSANWTGISCNDEVTTHFSLSTSSLNSTTKVDSSLISELSQLVSQVQELSDNKLASLEADYSVVSTSSVNTADKVCDGEVEGSPKNWNYGLTITAVCFISLGSFSLHVFICIRGKGRLKEILKTHIIMSSVPKQKRRRRRRKKFTPIMEESSSDCSI